MTITTMPNIKHKEPKASRGVDHPIPHHNQQESHFSQT